MRMCGCACQTCKIRRNGWILSADDMGRVMVRIRYTVRLRVMVRVRVSVRIRVSTSNRIKICILHVRNSGLEVVKMVTTSRTE